MKEKVLVPPVLKLDGVIQCRKAPLHKGSQSKHNELMFSGSPHLYYGEYFIKINGDEYLFVVSESSVVEVFSKDYPTILSPTTNTGMDHRVFITRSEITGGAFRHNCSVDFTDLNDCFFENSHVNNSFPAKFTTARTVYTNLELTNSSITNSVLSGGGTFNVSSLDGVDIKIPDGDYGLNFCDLKNVGIFGDTALLELDTTDIGDSQIDFEEQFISNGVSITNLSLYGSSINLTDVYSLFTVPTKFDDFIVYEDGKDGWELSGPSGTDGFSNIKITTLEEVTQFVLNSITLIEEPEETVILESIAQLVWDSYVSRKRLLNRIRGSNV